MPTLQIGSGQQRLELAGLLGIKPRDMLTQLAEWARLGLLTKTGPGRYAPPAPANDPGP
jgi:hypothetical protein